jgi:molybdopterin converting factor subunit 1
MNQSDNITIQILLFGAARDEVGDKEIELSIGAPATVASVFETLSNKFTGLKKFGRSLLFAVNQEYADRGQSLQNNDELAIFPPVSGGSQAELKATENSDFFEITKEPIDVGEVARRVVLPECGATVSLDGYAREWTAGRRTVSLEYEAYEPMALKELERLGERAHEKFAIAHIGVVHRIGRLAIGETSVVIAVSAPHRKAAFEACEWAIRELKRTVPIWKKEIFEDGEQWVEGENAPS